MAGAKFEIQIKNGTRWSLHSYKPNQEEAIAEARKLLKQNICEAAQVVLKSDHDEKTIFSEDASSTQKKGGINHVKDAPLCNQVEDLYSEESRKTIAALLQNYCDHTPISPTELLHSHRDLEKFMDSPLFSAALDRIASIQAVKAGEAEQARRDTLYDLVKNVQERARLTGSDELPQGGLSGYIMGLGDLNDINIRCRFMTSLSALTLRSTSWESKLSTIFALVGDCEPEDLDEATHLLLDDILSELLTMPTLILEILGQQPDRYNAISILTKTCTGKYTPRKWDTVGLKHISGLTAKHPMKKSRKALAGRIESMIRGRLPLTKGDMLEEKHAFKQLFPLFISKNGTIFGGESMIEALSERATRSFSRDKSLDKPSEPINYILEQLNAPISQLRYLLSLAHTQFGQECGDIISAFIPTFMDGPEHVHDIAHYKLPTKRKIKIITDLQKSALKVKIPQKMNLKLVKWLDEILYHFLDEERIVDKMDSPEETLHVRATQLLQFCASGLLIEGHTLHWVRERVQDHLRQANFVEKFTEGLETAEKKEKAITQLHLMLKKAGLNK